MTIGKQRDCSSLMKEVFENKISNRKNCYCEQNSRQFEVFTVFRLFRLVFPYHIGPNNLFEKTLHKKWNLLEQNYLVFFSGITLFVKLKFTIIGKKIGNGIKFYKCIYVTSNNKLIFPRKTSKVTLKKLETAFIFANL